MPDIPKPTSGGELLNKISSVLPKRPKNIIDYVKETPQSFSEKPFCDVDSLVLSQLSYYRFEDLEFFACTDTASLCALSDSDDETLTTACYGADDCLELLNAVKESHRFADLKVSRPQSISDTELEKQFAAFTFLCEDFSYIAFRGTDSSFVGWKEDLNLAFVFPLPSQLSAVKYIDSTIPLLSGTVYIGGHSKGGNLAIYGAANCKVRNRAKITAVFDHDGPGFSENFLKEENYLSVKNRIHKTVPRSSLVGMLFNADAYAVVKSTAAGVAQHSPLTWVISEGGFAYEDKLSVSAEFTDRSLNNWISSLSRSETSEFVSALYEVLLATGVESFNELPKEWWKTASLYINAMKNIGPQTRSLLFRTIGSLFILTAKDINLPNPKELFNNFLESSGLADKSPFKK